MAAGRGGGVERIKRCVRTIYFVVCMVMSLLAFSAPLLVSIGDVLVHCVLVSSFVCVSCQSIIEHVQGYEFASSLVDFLLVSVIRSLVIICVYCLCNSLRLSHGPYVGITLLCSFVSVLVLSVKASVFTENSETDTEAPSSLAIQNVHWKKSWQMPVLFFTSVVFALSHVVVAYRTRCRAQRKLLFHRADSEALLSCKSVFSSYRKVPRSPTPSEAKNQRSSSELRRKLFCSVQDERDFSVRLLADIDSFFMVCQGLTLHYKLSFPKSPVSLSLGTPCKLNTSCRLPHRTFEMLRVYRPHPNFLSKTQYHQHRSFNSQLSDSLHTPLLDHSVSFGTHISKNTPMLSSTGSDGDDGTNVLNFTSLEADLEKNEKFGVILVHGFGGGVFSWRHVMVELAQQLGCVVAAFDRPGWGLTSRPCRKDWEEKELSNPYSLETQVDLLLAFCLEMGFSSVVLVGHDDGGLLALKAAQRIQASKNSCHVGIKGVVLLSLNLSRDVVPPLAKILLRTSLGKKHLIRPLLEAEITQVVNRRAWYDVTKLTMEVLSLYKAPLCIEGWDEALNEIAKLSSETVLSSQNMASLLKAVEDLPILVIVGAEDALVSLKSTHAMVSKLVNSRFVALSGCGHLPHEECPGTVLSALSPFITWVLQSPNQIQSLPNQ